jgi:hypothetical protein
MPYTGKFIPFLTCTANRVRVLCPDWLVIDLAGWTANDDA